MPRLWESAVSIHRKLQVTNLSAFAKVSMAEVEDRLIAGLSRVLGYNDRLRQVAGDLP